LAEKDKFLKANDLDQASKINCIDLSYAGGKNGSEIILKILDSVAQLLKSPGGILYLLLLKDNNISEIIKIMVQNYGFKWQTLAKVVKYNEILFIMKFTKT